MSKSDSKPILKFLAEPRMLKLRPLRAFAAGVNANAVLFVDEKEAVDSLTGNNECLIVMTNRCSCNLVKNVPKNTRIILHKTKTQIDACISKLDQDIFKTSGVICNDHGKLVDTHFARQAIYSGVIDDRPFEINRMVSWGSPSISLSEVDPSEISDKIEKFNHRYSMPFFIEEKAKTINEKIIQQIPFLNYKIKKTECTTDSLRYVLKFTIEFPSAIDEASAIKKLCHQMQELQFPGVLVHMLSEHEVELVFVTEILDCSINPEKHNDHHFFLIGLHRINTPWSKENNQDQENKKSPHKDKNKLNEAS